MTIQIKSPGELGFGMVTDELRDLIPNVVCLIRGHGGDMFGVWYDDADSDVFENKKTLSLCQIIEADDPQGPLVSRKRFVIDEDFIPGVLIDLEETPGAGVHNDLLVDELQKRMQKREEAWTNDTLDGFLVTLGIGDGKVIATASEKPPSRRSVARLIDDAWRDDDWAPTVEEAISEIEEVTGREVEPEAIRKAFQRGPFDTDGKRPARYTRVVVR